MKIKSEHLYRMQELLPAGYALKNMAERYRKGYFHRAEKCKDLKKRFCFDVFHIITHGKHGLVNDLYAYLNDEHIYTALKSLLAYELTILGETK